VLILVIIAISFAIFILFFYAIRNELRVVFWKSKNDEQLVQLKLGDTVEQQLREEISNLQQKLQRVFSDPITKLPGWQLFEDRLLQSIKETERYHITAAVMWVDLSEFRLINEALGYEIADLLLVEVATRIQSVIRQVDTVSRYTKDIFAVLLSQLTKPESVAIVAQRTLQAIAEPFYIKSHELFINANIGIAICPDDAKDIPNLLQKADQALHIAKQHGKQHYQFYSDTIHEVSMRQLALTNYVNHENLFNQLQLSFAAVVDSAGQQLKQIDVHLNWQQPEQGLVPSDELFELAQRQGKLNAITGWMLQAACKAFLTWQSAGCQMPAIRLPVFLSQLANTQYVYHISQILQDLNFDPKCLILEVKQTLIPTQWQNYEKSFNMLNYLGIQLAINDFGADIFSFSLLRKFNFNYYKLDKHLTDDIVSNANSQAIVRSAITLASDLKAEVIADNINTEAQQSLLLQLGCNLMQGPLYGEAMTLVDMVDKIKNGYRV
jgi:diguanylate cyclase (GGDEF)-like protein